jgi:hypothetical protein
MRAYRLTRAAARVRAAGYLASKRTNIFLSGIDSFSPRFFFFFYRYANKVEGLR